jgi:hypothetical protein
LYSKKFLNLATMANKLIRRSLFILGTCLLILATWSTPSALAVNNPELLPDKVTPVVDLANFIPTLQEESLTEDLEQFEAQTGWKMRVLTQYDRSPGRAVKKFWGLDDKSILLVADGRGGNLLAFSIGDDVYELLPRNFWIELQTRFGNMYYIREHGENNAIVEALESVQGCLLKNGCNAVPGLPQEQWILTLISSIVGGIILGVAVIPRNKDQFIAWQWGLIMSPLWGILFIAFGMGPVIIRTPDFLPLFRNIIGFLLGAVVAFISPTFLESPTSDSET